MRIMKDSGIEWIGKIPESWETSKLLYTLKSKITDGPHETPETISEGIPFISVDSINDSEFIDLSVVEKYISESDYIAYNRKTILEPGDVLFTKAATIGKTAIVHDELFMIWSPIAVLKTNKSIITSKFLYYLLSCKNLIDEVRLNGSFNTQANVGMRELEKTIIPLCSTEKQQDITEYLDAKCEEIDALIAAKEKSNALLKEQRQSIIYEAVTKGLDPNTPMKDSGVEWIGKVSEEAQIVRLKHYSYMKGRIGWQGLRAEDFTDIGPYCVTGTDFINGRIEWSLCYHVSEERYEMDKFIQLKNGDLLITKDGTIGKLAKVNDLPGKACLNSHLLIIRPLKNIFTNDYLYYVLSSDVFWNYYKKVSIGTIMDSVSQETMGNFSFPVYTIERQNQIVKRLDKKCAEIDSMILANETTITKLKEYRQSMIYEAVTGKVEI